MHHRLHATTLLCVCVCDCTYYCSQSGGCCPPSSFATIQSQRPDVGHLVGHNYRCDTLGLGGVCRRHTG